MSYLGPKTAHTSLLFLFFQCCGKVYHCKMNTSWTEINYSTHSDVCALCVMWPSSANPPTYSVTHGFHPWNWTSGQQVSFSVMIRGCTLSEQNYLFIIKCNFCKKHLHFIILLRIYSNTLYSLHVNQDIGEKLIWKNTSVPLHEVPIFCKVIPL